MREITLDDIGKLGDTVSEAFANVDISTLEKGNTSASDIIKMLVNPNTMTAVKSVVALLTDQPKEKYKDLSVIRFTKIVKLFFEVNPLEDLKELFTILTDLQPKKESTEI